MLGCEARRLRGSTVGSATIPARRFVSGRNDVAVQEGCRLSGMKIIIYGK